MLKVLRAKDMPSGWLCRAGAQSPIVQMQGRDRPGDLSLTLTAPSGLRRMILERRKNDALEYGGIVAVVPQLNWVGGSGEGERIPERRNTMTPNLGYVLEVLRLLPAATSRWTLRRFSLRHQVFSIKD